MNPNILSAILLITVAALASITLIIVIIAFVREQLTKRKASGTLIIDYADPNKDVYTIQIDDDLLELVMKKYIILKVKVND